MRYIVGTITNDGVTQVRITPIDQDNKQIGEPTDNPSVKVTQGTLFAVEGIGLVLKTKEESTVDNTPTNDNTEE